MKKSCIYSCLLIGLWFGASNAIAAQMLYGDRDTENQFFRTIRANQQESYITFGGGLGHNDVLIFEAYVSPYFLLRTSKNVRWGATLSPSIIMRMYALESFPVYTPSYMPHLSFYRLLSGTHDDRIRYVFLTLAHHSNGQDDPFYKPDGTINRISGDFSTNYIELGIFFNERIVPFSNTLEYFRISMEYHPDFYRTAELDGQYGFVRLNNSFRVFRTLDPGLNLELRRASRLQTTLHTTWIFGKLQNSGSFDLKERFIASLTFTYRPGILSDVGFFINFYTGKDYYNILFNERLSVIRFGIQAFTKR